MLVFETPFIYYSLELGTSHSKLKSILIKLNYGGIFINNVHSNSFIFMIATGQGFLAWILKSRSILKLLMAEEYHRIDWLQISDLQLMKIPLLNSWHQHSGIKDTRLLDQTIFHGLEFDPFAFICLVILVFLSSLFRNK